MSNPSDSLMADLRYKICLKLGYDDGVKGTQHCIITEKNFEDIIALIKAHSLQERNEARKREARLLNALGDIYGQYCPGKYGHHFMSAGECAIDVLEDYGVHSEEWEFDESAYQRLETAVKQLEATREAGDAR